MSGKRGLSSTPFVEMERRVGAIMEHMIERHERLKARRFGLIVSPLTILAGLLLLIVGVIALPAPGPGWLLIFTALGVLSLELRFARGTVLSAARGFDKSERWYRRRNPAVQLTLVALTTLSVMAIMGGTYYLVAPTDWPLTRAAH